MLIAHFGNSRSAQTQGLSERKLYMHKELVLSLVSEQSWCCSLENGVCLGRNLKLLTRQLKSLWLRTCGLGLKIIFELTAFIPGSESARFGTPTATWERHRNTFIKCLLLYAIPIDYSNTVWGLYEVEVNLPYNILNTDHIVNTASFFHFL